MRIPSPRCPSNRVKPIITLVVFCGFAVFYLGEKIRWNHVTAFASILAAVAFTFLPKN